MSKTTQPEINDKIQMRIDSSERNIWRDEAKRRYHVDRRSRTIVILGTAVVPLFFICIFLPNAVADEPNLSLAWYLEMIVKNIGTFFAWISGDRISAIEFIYYQFISAAFVGAALATSGAVYQGTFKNALASPSTLGVQTGGVLGGTIFVLFFMKDDGTNVFNDGTGESIGIFARFAFSLFIMMGCFLIVSIVLILAKSFGKNGKLSTLTLILSGTVFAGCIGEILSLIRYKMLVTDNLGTKTYAMRYMMMGSFNSVQSASHMFLIIIPISIAILIVMLLRSRLNLLVFGEDEARSMGINVDFIRNMLIAIVTALTAVVISFCGSIGFIGFITPHVARRMVGPDFRYLLPASALLGSCMLLIVLHLAQALNMAININLMTSVAGGAVFLFLLLYFRRRGHADWA